MTLWRVDRASVEHLSPAGSIILRRAIGEASLKEVGYWGHVFDNSLVSDPFLPLYLCFLVVMRWAALICNATLLPVMLMFGLGLVHSNGTSTRGWKPLKQWANISLLSRSFQSQLFITVVQAAWKTHPRREKVWATNGRPDADGLPCCVDLFWFHLWCLVPLFSLLEWLLCHYVGGMSLAFWISQEITAKSLP